MKKLLIASIAAAALYSAPALAGPPPSTFNWSGFYAGGNIGYLRGNVIDSMFPIAPAFFVPNLGLDTTAGGGQIGIQQQWGNAVLGVEGGVTWPFSSKFKTVEFSPASADSFAARMSEPIYFVGPRLGTSIGGWMPYVTGGYASTQLQTSQPFKATGVSLIETSAHRNGWYLGGGVDCAHMGNWLLGIEYRHYDFGNKLHMAFSTVTGAAVPGNNMNVGLTADTVLLRLSYKVGAP
jgi:outer membrane immunogenic protein